MDSTLYLVPVSLSPSASLQRSFPDFNIDVILQTRNFIVENARTARQFLSQCGKKDIASLNINEIDKNNLDLEQVKIFMEPLSKGEDVAILSESGCPCVADPGNIFVQFAHEKGIKVVPLIGPSSILLALMASGLNGQNFCFHGYLPIKKVERELQLREIIRDVKNFNGTAIFIETPYRNQAIFQYLKDFLPNDFLLCIAKNLTGENEFIRTKTIAAWKREDLVLEKMPTIFLLGK